MIALPLIGCLLSLVGCSSPQGTTVSFPSDQYEDAFTVTRDALRQAGFTVERIDADAGVIATGRKGTSGLATPWDQEQQSVGQELEDLLNNQSRSVRVTFRPVDSRGEGPEGASSGGAEMTARIDVTIERAHNAGWRPETESIRTSSRWADRTLYDENKGGVQYVPVSRDDAFGAVLAQRINEALERLRAPRQEIVLP